MFMRWGLCGDGKGEMSVIKDLKIKVQRLKDQLEAAEKSLYAAMIEAEPLKAGDIVDVITSLDGWDAQSARTRVECGQVRSVSVRHDSVHVDIACATKSGYHSRNSIHVGYRAKISKICERTQPDER